MFFTFYVFVFCPCEALWAAFMNAAWIRFIINHFCKSTIYYFTVFVLLLLFFFTSVCILFLGYYDYCVFVLYRASLTISLVLSQVT